VKTAIHISSAGVFGSALLWLLSFKVVAYWLGPAGVGLFGQLRQLVQAASIGATLGGTNAIVQGLSERSDEVQRHQFRGTVSRIIALTTISISVAMFFGAQQIAQMFLSANSPELIRSIQWLSLAVLLNAGAIYMMGVLNGYHSFKYLAAAQVAGPLFLAAGLLIFSRIPSYQAADTMAAMLVLCFGLMFLLAWYGVSSAKKMSYQKEAPLYLSKPETLKFIHFSSATLFVALSSSITMLVIRAWIIREHGLEFAGLFDAAWTMTFTYVTLFLTACSTIYLPVLTSAANLDSQKKYITETGFFVLSFVIMASYIMTALKTPLIHLLYSSKFNSAENLLCILTIAMILRSMSWVYSMLMVSSKDSKMLFLSEFGFNVFLLVLVRVTLKKFTSLESLGWAFVITNLLYVWLIMLYVKSKNHLITIKYISFLIIGASLPLFFSTLNDNLQANIFLLDTVGKKTIFLLIGIFFSFMSWRGYKNQHNHEQ